MGSCDTLAQLFPAFLGFWVMHLHFNGVTLSHGSLTSGPIAITSFLRVTGRPLFAAVPGENVQRQADQQRHIDAKHLGLGSAAHKTFHAGFIDRKICSRRIMDGSSNAGLGSTSTWVGCFFFFSVRVVTVATINVGE